jgi:hypothetical protein
MVARPARFCYTKACLACSVARTCELHFPTLKSKIVSQPARFCYTKTCLAPAQMLGQTTTATAVGFTPRPVLYVAMICEPVSAVASFSPGKIHLRSCMRARGRYCWAVVPPFDLRAGFRRRPHFPGLQSGKIHLRSCVRLFIGLRETSGDTVGGGLPPPPLSHLLLQAS